MTTAAASIPAAVVIPASYRTLNSHDSAMAKYLYTPLANEKTGTQRCWVLCLKLKAKFQVTKLNCSRLQ